MNKEKVHILLVEDEEAHVELIVRAFEPQAGRVSLTVAHNLGEARSILAASPPDLVLVDQLLPDGKGTELLPAEQEESLYPIVILTSHGNEQVAVEAMKAGALDYVVKSETALADTPRIAERILREWGHITECKRAEKALREKEQAYATLLSNLSGMAYRCRNDPDWTMELVSDGCLELTGYPSSDLLYNRKLSFGSLIHPDDLQQRREKYQAALEARRPCNNEYRLITASGEVKWVWDQAQGIYAPSGELIAIEGFITDITGRVQMEEEKARLEVLLRQSQKLETIGTLAGGIAHDFNNLLTPIIGYTDLILSDLPQDSPIRVGLEQTLLAANRAKDLVQQILTFSRQTEQERRPIQVHPIIKEALKLLRSSLPATIDIRHNINTDCGNIIADPTQIHQVLMNFCTNAYDAMRERGGVLEVNLDAIQVDGSLAKTHPNLHEGDYVRLTISDTGHGMDYAILERIFDPFFTTKEVGKGTGLGLSVVHGIVVSHGGAITVTSEPGKGTLFHVYFPRTESPIEQEVPKNDLSPKGKERILFVDDQDAIAYVMEEILSQMGYTVTAMTSSLDALAVFRDQPDGFDLVITDMTMPGMTGVQLAQELMRLRPDIPIILITGYNEAITPEKSKALGIREYVMKPFTSHDLNEAIRRVLDQGVEN